MSMDSRREYVNLKSRQYRNATSRKEKTEIINEVVSSLKYNRKHAIRVLNNPMPAVKPKYTRKRPIEYVEAMPAIQLVWESLDYPCAERLHPVLLSTANLLEHHGEVTLSPVVREQISQISCSTLARRIANWDSPITKFALPHQKGGARLKAEIPVAIYKFGENRPGALQIDLVEHNGGNSSGHYAYTLTVVDIVSGYSRRMAVLGRGQAGIHAALAEIIQQWPHRPWGLHSDNGSEFINNQLVRFCKDQDLEFTRSRPYRKNDNAHAEQKNRQYVREVVGYGRYDTPEDVEWLNKVYACLDPYANLILPMRKTISKKHSGTKAKKDYDTARAPIQRLFEANAIDPKTKEELEQQIQNTNPLAIHQELENLLLQGPKKEPTLPEEYYYEIPIAEAEMSS